MTNQDSTLLGSVTAFVAGDSRYSSTLLVRAYGRTLRVELETGTPMGGMDSQGTGSHRTHDVRATVELGERGPTAKALLKALRSAIKRADGGIIARYGTPTKRFTWRSSTGLRTGLSETVVSAVLFDYERVLADRAAQAEAQAKLAAAAKPATKRAPKPAVSPTRLRLTTPLQGLIDEASARDARNAARAADAVTECDACGEPWCLGEPACSCLERGESVACPTCGTPHQDLNHLGLEPACTCATRAPEPKSKGGRPRHPMSERHHVRLTPDQLAEWTAVGKRCGLDLGGVLRAGAALLERTIATMGPDELDDLLETLESDESDAVAAEVAQ